MRSHLWLLVHKYGIFAMLKLKEVAESMRLTISVIFSLCKEKIQNSSHTDSERASRTV